MTLEHFDVLIIGAGLSGIGAGYHLQSRCPAQRYAILEARQSIGGTWDLFRYPGVRSDSDMYTLGYSFNPWTGSEAIASGWKILDYVRDTARRYRIDQHIRFEHRVIHAAWSSTAGQWTVEAQRGPRCEPTRFTCNFLLMCSGYYKYEHGYRPEFPGAARFKGRIVHPQRWTDDIEYAHRRVLVIGSGATAVTLVPELAKSAAHVTMLQRSPTYVVSMPAKDPLAERLRRFLPSRLVYAVARWKNVLIGLIFYQLCRRRPRLMKHLIGRGIERALGPNSDARQHFTPTYNPWDQRLCLVPNGDLFEAIKQGSVDVVTDHIDTFTESGVKLRSGSELHADVIVTATGLELQLFGGMQVSIDGRPIDFSQALTYKGMMFEGVPNFASVFGYTNASWTLKCELTCVYVCRLLGHMLEHGYRVCTARNLAGAVEQVPWIDFSSGYVQRASASLPKQGTKKPWKLHQNYVLDLLALKFGSVADGAMQFSNPRNECMNSSQSDRAGT